MEVTFDPESRTIGIKVDATCLSLVAVVESVVNMDTTSPSWQIIENIPLKVSGSGVTYREAVLEQFNTIVTARMSSARSLGHEDVIHYNNGFLGDDLNPKVRVKLCLRTNTEHCGEYRDAESKLFVM